MKETEENNPEESYEELSGLRESLRQAIDDGDMERAGDLKDQIMPHLNVLRGEFSSAFDEAKEIMGEDFLGPEAIKETFGIKVETKDVPEIPFSKKELERAKELEQFLVLRVDKRTAGDDLTIRRMAGSFNGNVIVRGELRFDPVVAKSTPETGWALVTKNLVPLSKNRDYLEQVGALAQYLDAQVFKGKANPGVYQQALNEFLQEYIEIQREVAAESKKVFRKISDLKITKLLMPSAPEAVYDMLMYCKNNNKLNMFGGPGDTHGVVTRDIFSDEDGVVEVTLDTHDILVMSNSVHQEPDSSTGTLFARRF